MQVAYGNGLFVAVGDYRGGSSNTILTSPDGSVWTGDGGTYFATDGWDDITFGNGLFVAVSKDVGTKVMTSPDGITWTPRDASDAQWLGISHGDGKFVAVAYDGAVMTSNSLLTLSTVLRPDPLWYSHRHQ